MQKAYTAARKAIESTFRGTMSVYEYGTKRDEKTKLQRSGETCVLTDVPCKVSFESSTSAAHTGNMILNCSRGGHDGKDG